MEACVNVLKTLPAEIAEKHISAWVGYCVDALVNDYEQYSAPQIDDDQALASPAASPLQEPQEPVRSFSSGHDQLGGATSAGQQSFAGQPKTPIKTSIMPGQNPVNVLAESGRTAVGESEQRLQLELEKKATVRRPPVHRRDPALKMPRLLAGVCAGEGGLDAQTQPGAAGEAAQEGEAEGAQAHDRQARLGPARGQSVRHTLPPTLSDRRSVRLTLRGAHRHERSMKEKNKENHAKQLAQSKSRKEELKKQSEADAEEAQYQRDMARAMAASNETRKTEDRWV